MPKAADLWAQFQNQSGAKPRILRKFTGRHIFLRDHYKLVSRAIEEELAEYYIRNYHGIGGAGKSTLLRRLEAELLGDEKVEKLPGEEFPEELSEDEAKAFREARACCENARASVQDRCRRMGWGKKPVALRADFDDDALKSPKDVLLRFRSQLMQQYDKAMFPLFDVAMLRLAQKYGGRLPPDKQKEMLIDNPVISFALDTVGDLTGVGMLIGAGQTAAKVGKSMAQTLAGRKSVIRKVNEEASRMDAPDLERRLPCYFAMDVNAMNLPLICVYLDTYEKMTAQAEGAGWSAGFDEEWLKGDFGLVRNLGNAVFAIAGRNKLGWDDLPVEECCVEAQHVAAQSVEALSKAESLIFLASCGIKDTELCSRLYELTGGDPIYLDLCVDEYERLTASGKEQITIEDFGGDWERLVERHTRYIPQNLRDAAIAGLEQVLELGRRLNKPRSVLLNAQLQIGWDHKLAKRREEACTALEAALQGLAALDREAGRAYTPKTLLAAELLCQCYDDPELDAEAHGLWSERLARVQTWLRSLDYALTGEESLEELLDWKNWVDTGHSGEFWFHSGVGKEGADTSERLECAASLDEQVISGLEKHLGKQHPTVLDANMTLANIYMNRESAKGTSAIVDTDYFIQLMEDNQQPLGSVPENNNCIFPDPETVLSTCRRLVEGYTSTMGREYPNTYEAKNLLAHAYEMAGRPEDAIPLRQELWAAYDRLDDQASRKEALRQNSLLIRDSRLAGQWEKAIVLQTSRLERARTDKLPELPLEQERDGLCTLCLSRLWQDEELSQDQARELLAGLLALTEEYRPINRKRYLDSAWQWCRDYAEEDTAADVALALADILTFEDEVIDLLEPYGEERTLPASRRCAILLRLGRAYRSVRSGRERSVELLAELTELLDDHPEVEAPDMGTALLELGLSRRKLAASLVGDGDNFRKTAKAMLDALRGALAWREEHLSPEDPAADAARFELAGALVWVGAREEAVPLLETVVPFRTATLGEAARKTVEAELELSAALARTEGRYEEARALFQAARRHVEGMSDPPSTFKTQYALYRGAGGALSSVEWQEAGEPEHD